MLDSTSTPAQLPKSSPRNNGKLRACAECRRLKLRCDRNFPCQACVRRGCSAICPDKCFTDKATPSSLKANTLRSREQIQSLESRIATLEQALAQEHPSHPLITPEGSPSSLDSTAESEDPLEEAVDILGELSIAEDGSTVFRGAASSTELPIQESARFPDPHLLSDGDQQNLPNNIQLLSALFPFTPHSVASSAVADDFLPFMPPAEEALAVLTQYWHHFDIHAPITRKHFTKYVYEALYIDNKPKCHLVRADSHRLGLLFITLAMGVIADCNKPMLSMEAETYYQLSRAALSLDPVCDNTTIPGMQCMFSMLWYMRVASTRASQGYGWAFQGILIKLASSIGIFRDSRKWLSDVDEIEQREILCWELICMELWTAFLNGRPANVDLSLVDCQRPSDIDTDPGSFSGYHCWKYSFYSLINKVLLLVMRPNPVKYSEILTLERQLRECPMPPGLEIPLHGSPLDGLPDDATTLHLQRFTALMIKETTSCMLHRRFLVLVMEKGCDVLPFQYSALRAGHSARWIVTSQLIMYRRYPKLISRIPTFWSASFSAAIILGAIAARFADRDFAQCALIPFEAMCALFAEAAGHSIQPPHALESLQRLQKRVRTHFSSAPVLNRALPTDNVCSLGGDSDISQTMSAWCHPQAAVTTPSSSSSTGVSKASSPNVDPLPGNFNASSAGISIVGGDILDPMTAEWPAFDPTYPLDDSGIHVVLPKSNQEWQPSWPEGVSATPLEISTMGSSVAEVGQWNLFLNNLGVWD